MSVKEIVIDGVGPVNFHKRKGARSVKISITHDGNVRVSLPFWAPYSAGIQFVESRKDWILNERPQQTILAQGARIGKTHHITFESGSGQTPTSRLTANQVRILLPIGTRWDDDTAQAAARNGAIKALKKEARMLLPHRLRTLAEQHGYSFTSVTVKQLTGRWGSCSDKQEITLNCFLMQLPWDLIDYVLLHELAHTKVMAHGTPFWTEMARALPTVQNYRKLIKTYKPVL